MKDEAEHLLEWISFHRVLGVEKFFLYDNGSSDRTPRLLAPLIATGLVECISWPYRPGQLQAYDDFARRNATAWKWAAFIDLDEFIVPQPEIAVRDWLRAHEHRSGVALHWRNFGPSGHERPPTELTIEAYRYRLPLGADVNGHVKTIVRMDAYRHAITPHAFAVDGVVIDASGRIISAGSDDYSVQPPLETAPLALNHYYTRSREDWARKFAKGAPDHAEGDPNPRQHHWFELYVAHAVIEDSSADRFAARTREELTRLGRSDIAPA